LPSRPSSKPGVPKQDVLAAIDTSRPSVLGNTNQHQNSSGRLCVDRAPNDSSVQHAEAARAVTQTNDVDSKSPPATHSSVAQEAANLPCIPVHIEDIQPRWSPVQQRSSYMLATPSQQPLNCPRLTVSVFHGF
jgi:hypothetical protein